MLTIGKIREKKNFLMIIIVIALLLFLLPYDAIMSFIKNDNVGNVDGNSISFTEWQDSLAKRESTNLIYPDNSVGNSVWYDVVEQRLLADDYTVLGIDVSKDEYDAITLEKTPSKFVKSTFIGASAEVTDISLQNYKNHVNGIKDNVGYLSLKELIENKRKREKWESLIEKGLYSNVLEARMDYLKSEEKVNIDYVLIKYTDIADSLIKVEESEIRAYYNDHKNDADQKVITENRDIRYVEFNISASESDIEATRKNGEEAKSKWLTSDNDTTFCQYYNANFSDITFIEGAFDNETNDLLASDSTGTVIGPFKDSKTPDAFTLLKLIDRMEVSDSVQVRHILFKAENTMTQQDIFNLKIEADSVMALIADGTESFEDMAKKFSKDGGYTEENGGNYGWFKADGKYVEPFENFGFEKDLGDLDIVITQFGYHIMEVVEQSPKVNSRIKYKRVDFPISPSTDTRKSVYNLANDFSLSTANDPDLFDSMADSLGLNINDGLNVYRRSKNVGSLQGASDVINWVYQMKEPNQVSPPRQVANTYVVAVIDKIKKSGIPEYENVKDAMELEVLKEKQGKYYSELMDLDDLQSIAEAIGGEIKTARAISLQSTNITGSGVSGAEPKVVGLCFGFDVNEMSSPIIGDFGVYVIAPTSEVTEAAVKELFIVEQDNMIKAVQRTFSSVYPAMTNKADVQDNRLGN